MKYEQSKTSGSAPVFFLTELGDDELYAHAALEIHKKHGPSSVGTTPEGTMRMEDNLRELGKLGISIATLSAAWHIDEDTIERVALGKQSNMPSDYGWDTARETRDVHLPIDSIAIRAPQAALEPAPLAAGLSHITTGSLRRGTQQMTLAGIARMCAIDEDKLQKFTESGEQGSSGLTTEEAYRLCVALLIVDRELNFRPRGNYFAYKSSQEIIELEDGTHVSAQVVRFVPEDID
ncbi:MAG: hypothetical protein LBK23_04750 [Oscillospiraceae bacterium]|jgi:hypothetical protein|nr:hypothetical protein [Oscillospiraceae bacterium]